MKRRCQNTNVLRKFSGFFDAFVRGRCFAVLAYLFAALSTPHIFSPDVLYNFRQNTVNIHRERALLDSCGTGCFCPKFEIFCLTASCSLHLDRANQSILTAISNVRVFKRVPKDSRSPISASMTEKKIDILYKVEEITKRLILIMSFVFYVKQLKRMGRKQTTI